MPCPGQCQARGRLAPADPKTSVGSHQGPHQDRPATPSHGRVGTAKTGLSPRTRASYRWARLNPGQEPSTGLHPKTSSLMGVRKLGRQGTPTTPRASCETRPAQGPTPPEPRAWQSQQGQREPRSAGLLDSSLNMLLPGAKDPGAVLPVVTSGGPLAPHPATHLRPRWPRRRPPAEGAAGGPSCAPAWRAPRRRWRRTWTGPSACRSAGAGRRVLQTRQVEGTAVGTHREMGAPQEGGQWPRSRLLQPPGPGCGPSTGLCWVGLRADSHPRIR